MATSLLYCPLCGAANPVENSLCFACKQVLPGSGDNMQQPFLLQGRYQVLTQAGMGGFGAVYKAVDTHTQGRLVALKQINLRGLLPQEIIDATDGFNREVEILSRLSHPHLPRIHTQFTDPEHWYIVMDFIDGETLESYLRAPAMPGVEAIRALGLDEVLEIGLPGSKQV
ncbi:MAG TPA: protein kinase [Ktedonobacteraceae bacterium]